MMQWTMTVTVTGQMQWPPSRTTRSQLPDWFIHSIDRGGSTLLLLLL